MGREGLTDDKTMGADRYLLNDCKSCAERMPVREGKTCGRVESICGEARGCEEEGICREGSICWEHL